MFASLLNNLPFSPSAADAVPEDEGVEDLPTPKITKKDIERQMAKEQREIHNRRLARLQELRAAQKARSDEAAAMSAEKRLEFLMKQAELYSHFMHGGEEKAEAPAAAAVGGKRTAHKNEKAEEEELLEEEAGTMATKITQQPCIVTGKMRDYQLEGLNWMVNLHDNNISGILADEMGLGKTLQSISLLGYLKEHRGVKGPHLILVPKSVLGNWEREIGKWCPSLKCLKVHGDKETRQRIVREELMAADFEVVVCSFETLCIERAAFRKFSWYYVIIDEAHRIKNEKSVLSREVRSLDSAYRLLITGTPLQNNLHELWSLLNYLLPDVFSSSEDFDQWFGAGGSRKEDGETMIRKLHTIIRPFLLRRLKADVEHSLLPKIETKLFIGLTEMQIQLQKRILNKDVAALNAIGGPERSRLLNTLMQLRKACNHPYLFEGMEPGPPYVDGPHLYENAGKMVLLEKLLPKLKAQGSRALIFCQMTRMMDILEDYFRLKGYQYCRIDGNTSGFDREKAMDDYNAPDSEKFLFLLSTRAGGLGINLYTADVVILYDSDWNPQMDLQAMDRAHRIGQKKQVRVFRLITEKSVEEKIVERAERKLFLDAIVIQQGRLAQIDKGLSRNELMSMIKFGADEVFTAGATTNITDADIDIILAQGEEKTKAASEKMKRDMAKTLGSFNVDDILKSDTSTLLIPQDDVVKDLKMPQMIIELGEREGKAVRTYDVNALANPNEERGAKRGGPKQIRAPAMADFQFFEKARIEAIFKKENELLTQRREIERKLKEVRSQEQREARTWIRQRTKALILGSGEEGDLSVGGELPAILTETEAVARAEAEWTEKEKEMELESTKLEKQLETLELDEAEKQEKEELLAQGFGNWTKRDYKAFLSAVERNGRNAPEAIFAEVSEMTDKTVEEVAKYYSVFLKKVKDLPDAARILDRIERGEARIRRRLALERIIAEKVSRCPDPFRNLVIPYGVSKSTLQGPSAMTSAGRGFNEDEDRFLVCMLNVLGYGAWEALKAEIRKAEQFRFGWFMRSRSTGDLARRCDTLIRLLEQEAIEAGTPAGKEILAVSMSIQRPPVTAKKPRKEQTDAAGTPTAGGKRKRSSSAQPKGQSPIVPIRT